MHPDLIDQRKNYLAILDQTFNMGFKQEIHEFFIVLDLKSQVISITKLVSNSWNLS